MVLIRDGQNFCSLHLEAKLRGCLKSPANAKRTECGVGFANFLPFFQGKFRQLFEDFLWKDVRLKPSATMAKAEYDRTMTMNCLAKPTQRTGKPEVPARASVPESFRR